MIDKRKNKDEKDQINNAKKRKTLNYRWDLLLCRISLKLELIKKSKRNFKINLLVNKVESIEIKEDLAKNSKTYIIEVIFSQIIFD